MKYFVSFLIIFIANNFCFSQDTTNLVPNWSFEEKYFCPQSSILSDTTKNWFSPNNGTPNVFDSCSSKPSVGVPNNLSGHQYALSGNSYAGLQLIHSTEMEYVSVRLKEGLKLGNKYCFELYYSLANISCYSTTNIQVHFSADSIYQNNTSRINRIPNITNNNPFVDDTLNWQLMTGSYTAIGNEEYLTIGNFLPDSLSNVVLFDTDFSDCTWGGAYYIIDAVRLYDCTPPDTTVYEISIFPNPNNGNFTVNYNLGESINSGSFRIYDAIGKLVYNEKLTRNNGTLNLNLFLAAGVYFWEVSDQENKKLKCDKLVVY